MTADELCPVEAHRCARIRACAPRTWQRTWGKDARRFSARMQPADAALDRKRARTCARCSTPVWAHRATQPALHRARPAQPSALAQKPALRAGARAETSSFSARCAVGWSTACSLRL